jgi:hypothetical protein
MVQFELRYELRSKEALLDRPWIESRSPYPPSGFSESEVIASNDCESINLVTAWLGNIV